MNAEAHRRIMTAAYEALPENQRNILLPAMEILPETGNYPDLFDDPTRLEKEKDALDPNWRRFCQFPSTLAGRGMHFWPHRPTEAAKIRPMLEYLFDNAIKAIRDGDIDGGVKFLGCLSHYTGDGTQPAHLVDEILIKRLIPPPESMKDFHYHFDLEAVTGQCAALHPAQLLGTNVPEAMWRLADEIAVGFEYCQRYVVPSLQAIFAGKMQEAEALAGKPMTLSAEQTRDIMHTALCIATGRFDDQEVKRFEHMDIRDLRPSEYYNDQVYGGVLRDGNRKNPPRGQIVPAKLRIDGEIRPVKGLGVLPHSGMSRDRDCFLSYALPAGVFERFECRVGMHPELAKDAGVEFTVELDGKPLWRSGRMTETDESRPVSVKLKGAAMLTLRVTDANDGKSFWHNHSIWGNPVLIK